MNKKLVSLAFLLFGLLPEFVNAGGLSVVEKASQQVLPKADKYWQKQLDEVDEQKKLLLKEKKELDPSSKNFSEELKNIRERIQVDLKNNPESEYLKKKLAIFNETYQLTSDVQRSRDELIDLLDEYAKLLQSYLFDPNFSTFKKNRRLYEDRLYYSFEDLQKLHDAVLDQEKRVTQFTEQEKTARADLENRTRRLTETREAYKEKKKELLSVSKPEQEIVDEQEIKAHQIKDLLILEERVFSYRIRDEEMREREADYKTRFIALNLSMAESHRDILKNYLNYIKPSVRVSQPDIVDAQERLAKEKQKYYASQENLRGEIEKVAEQQKEKTEALNQASKQYAVPLGRDLDLWSKEPQETADSYVALCEVGAVNTQALLLDRQLELLNAQSVLEDEQVRYEKLQVEVKKSHFKIFSRKFVSREDVVAELKKYEAPKNEANASLRKYKEKLILATELLTTQKKILDNIAEKTADIKKIRETVFKSQGREFNRCKELLTKSQEIVGQRIELLSRASGVYSAINSLIGRSTRLINFTSDELEKLTYYHRPEGAISWTGIGSVITDIGVFLLDLRSYISRINAASVLSRVSTVFDDGWSMFGFMGKMLMLVLALFLFWWYSPTVWGALLYASESSGWLVRTGALLGVAALNFLHANFVLIALWVVAFAVLIFQSVTDPYPYIIFYLLSIPYLLFLVRRFVLFVIDFNIRHNYAFLAADFQRRFMLLFSFLLCATTIIFFLRQAFILTNYYRSELPLILLAINYIILQISLILLIDKELILNFIPTKNELWQWVHQQVDQYYYLILLFFIAIIVMSNPYVGYGELVLHILLRLIYTGFVVICLFWIHGSFKHISLQLFFVTSDEISRERFANAKTGFGLLIICSFIIFSLIGIIALAHIWNLPITFTDVAGWLYKPIVPTDDPRYPITVISLIKLVTLIGSGFFIAYAFNRFVLDRIFDLLLIDAGVQHTVVSLFQYLIVIAATFLGFQTVGLGSLVSYLIGALVLGVGFILKEPLGDFVAYFIILVQRPIKIGDYIKIDSETAGVVRKITARAVILRRKNSVTIVVPNAYVISHSVRNWNYARNFIAFDDIIVTIDYNADPSRVKQILQEIVESNENVLKNPKPVIRLDGFGDYGYVFMIRGFLSSAYTLQQWNIASDIRLTIVRVLRKNNIEMALPIRVMINRYERNKSLDLPEPIHEQEPPLDDEKR